VKILSSHDDLGLIQLYKESGDKDYVGELYTRYTALVYGVCLKYLKNRDESKDAVMQIFEKLLKILLVHEIENFKSWLYATARNHCLMELRSQKGKTNVDITQRVMENDFVLHLEEESDVEVDLRKLDKCLDELVVDQKQCVRLFFLEERCYKEISELTRLDLNKVKSHIQNGKRNLKLCMERNG
jgi:RNA polymerase sigma-70 factor (ECF subfamily)